MSKQNKGFRHFRRTADFGVGFSVPATKGGITMAFDAPKHIQDLTAADKVQVAFSFCSGADNFQRSVGRDIAVKRLEETAFTIPGDEFLEVLHAAGPDLINLPGLDADQQRYFARRVKSTIGCC